jgi:hypothetical protein
LYRVRVNPIPGYEIRDRQKARDATFVRSAIDQEKLRQFLRDQVRTAGSPFDKGRALRLLARLRDQEFVRVSSGALEGSDKEIGLQLADLVAEYMEHIEDEQTQESEAPNMAPAADV